MHEPSDEQAAVIRAVRAGKNVVVGACAGSGKSTVVLSIAHRIPDRKLLQITYNSSLRYEVRDKVREAALTNMEVHTYHSLAVHSYDQRAHNDTVMRRILADDAPMREGVRHSFDILVIDEAQDMTPLYYHFMQKFVTDCARPFQIVVLGDWRQGLYEFKGSDIRFLTLAPRLWRGNRFLRTQDFENLCLRMSYRITTPICSFVNDMMFGEEYMNACRDGPNVVYIKRGIAQIERIICCRIMQLIREGARPDDFFILCGSVRSSRVKRIENALVLANIPCFVPLFEGEKIDERVIGGKVGMSTFHSVKGRQRKYVFILGFDNSYFDYYGRDLPRDTCPNTLYVGATRASDTLFVCEGDDYATDRPLEFFRAGHRDLKKSPYVDFLGVPRSIFYENTEYQKREVDNYITSPSDLVRFLHEDILDIVTPILTKAFVFVAPEGEVFDIPAIVQTSNGLYEEVSDLNGIAIPCIYYDDINRRWSKEEESVLYDMIRQRYELIENPNPYLVEAMERVNPILETVTDYLDAANVYKAIDEQYYSKLNQIRREECTWLGEDDVEMCKTRIHGVIGKDCTRTEPEAEYTIIHHSDEEAHENIDAALEGIIPENARFRFTARVDLVCEDIVYELKCTTELTLEHQIQVAIYAWIYRMIGRPERKFRLFNIKTGEILELNASMTDLTTIMAAVLSNKFMCITKKSDDEFLETI